MKGSVGIVLLLVVSIAYSQVKPKLSGIWRFAGGIYNGKKEGAPVGYILQRNYRPDKFDAYMLEKGQKTVRYQSGNYQLKGDTCRETETFSAQPSQLTGKPIKYHYQLRHDSLILQSTLPTGMRVEEYWKKSK